MTALKAMRDELNENALLEIDGGVTAENAADIVRAGADVLVAGNTLFSAAHPEKVIEELHAL